MQLGGGKFRVPAGVTLRECSVVIIGSTCRICGKDFKCESDVALHIRWRHSGTIGSLIENHENLPKIVQRCDMCDTSFVSESDLWIHKRLIHKNKRRRRLRKVHVKLKLKGVTITDVYLDRKYLEGNDLGCRVDADTQTPDWDKHKKHHDCATNIDLFLRDYVVDNRHIEYAIWPHKANRYIVGKFAPTKDALAQSSAGIVEMSLAKIMSSMPKAIPDNDGSCDEYRNTHDRTFEKNTENDVFITSRTDVHDKENSHSLNERERRLHTTSPISNNFNNEKNKKKKSVINSSVDDDQDVQEVLRITRKNAQSDINHESPNRTEREMLIKKASEMHMPSIQGKSTCPEKCNSEFTANVEPSVYLPFTTITESGYQFVANTWDKKLGIYLEDLHPYGIKCCNNLPEINNNLEEYVVYDHQGFLAPWTQAAESQYTNELKTDDNEATVIPDSVSVNEN